LKLVHLSDTHLGFSAYRALDEERGINQREADINLAFAQAIEKSLSLKPDVLLHTGDLFDTVRPNNRTISFCLEQLLRLTRANIPVVIIAGNHSSPRMKDTGSIFRLFELFENIYPIYQGKYENVSFEDLTIHAVPQCPLQEDFHQNVQKMNASVKNFNAPLNVLALHAGVAMPAGRQAEIEKFSMDEFNEQIVPLEALKEEFDYIGLGHYHQFEKVTENAYYSGSTERLSFNEAGQEKGIVEVDLSSKDQKKLKVSFHALDIREMVDLPDIDAGGLSAEMVMKKIEEALASTDYAKKIVRLTLNNLSSPAYNSLDFHLLRNLAASALHFEFRYNRLTDETLDTRSGTIGGLVNEFADFMAERDLGKERDEVLKLGINYLESADS